MKQTIQWEEVRRRLRTTENSLRESLSESPERMKTVFRQRALQLAQEHAANQDGQDRTPASRGIPALIFRLAEERYAIALQELAEVLPFQGCVPVPGTPAHFLGVINLRGELRPVIDLAGVLRGSSSCASGAVLILREQGALKVDAVEDLREIRSEELTRPVHGHYIKAFAAGTVGLLDVETMLAAVLSPKESRPI